MKNLGVISDPIFKKKASYTAVDRFFLRLIRDERDLPFAYLSTRITLFMLPLAFLLYLPFISGWLWWVIAAAYFFLNNFYFKGPFGLMLHCTSHRPFFKERYGWMNHYLPWIVAPFFGNTPETYFIHHVAMHHVENNLEEDISSTMAYRRDSFREFLKYLANFLFLAIFQLYDYHKAKKRNRFLPRLILGELTFYILCVLLCFINVGATVVAFILPYFIFRIITMMGNWTQHSFIDPDEPGNLYKSSINCINVKYNKKCWNDGYHISHHIRPNLHWTQHPLEFIKNKDKYAENEAIVFDGLDFLEVFIHLMRKRYVVLAEHFVNIDGRYTSDEEVIRMLKRRTQKILLPAPSVA